MYTRTYQAACSHLVAFGAHGGDTNKGRNLIARAIKEWRAIDKKRARREYHHMRYISGMMPIKKAKA